MWACISVCLYVCLSLCARETKTPVKGGSIFPKRTAGRCKKWLSKKSRGSKSGFPFNSSHCGIRIAYRWQVMRRIHIVAYIPRQTWHKRSYCYRLRYSSRFLTEKTRCFKFKAIYRYSVKFSEHHPDHHRHTTFSMRLHLLYCKLCSSVQTVQYSFPCTQYSAKLKLNTWK